ncbi:MAG: VanW family protein, partial [bacterium]|nr:VanW family protein [bacterium]
PQNAADRVFNIRKAAAAIDGVILAPDAAFDCNAVLGDRNEENGWRMAAGIRGGQYVQEYGGGVCQVSSTLFNAVMMADLPITERHPHSWPMSYVDIGRDATISTGGKNFCFVNSTGAPLTLSASVDGEGQTVTVALYGTPVLPDGQYITVSSERTGTLPALPDELLLDESLPYGTRVVEREGREGRTARTYKEYHAADGTLLRRELAYEDTYRSISARVYVSTDLYAAKTTAAED